MQTAIMYVQSIVYKHVCNGKSTDKVFFLNVHTVFFHRLSKLREPLDKKRTVYLFNLLIQGCNVLSSVVFPGFVKTH